MPAAPDKADNSPPYQRLSATGANSGIERTLTETNTTIILPHCLQRIYKAHPQFQREDGDFLNGQIPGTEYHLPIFQSGFGDGVYPVYWGMDETGNICQIVIQFIDIELAYGEKTADE